MIVYIEYAILDNMSMDCVLLYLVALTLQIRCAWYRILLGGVVGTACALLVPVVPVWCAYVIKVLCLLVMCIVCFGKTRLLYSCLLLVVYTFVLGGVLIGILALLGVSYTISSTTYSYYSSIPIGMYIIAVVVCVVLCVLVVRYIKSRHMVSHNVIDIVIMIAGTHISCSGYIDSGNMLLVDNVPVCFVCGAIGKKVSQYIASAVLLGNSVAVSYKTMAGSNSSVAIPAKIAIQDRVCSVLLCVNAMSSAHGCDVLINYKVMEV